MEALGVEEDRSALPRNKWLRHADAAHNFYEIFLKKWGFTDLPPLFPTKMKRKL